MWEARWPSPQDLLELAADLLRHTGSVDAADRLMHQIQEWIVDTEGLEGTHRLVLDVECITDTGELEGTHQLVLDVGEVLDQSGS